MSLESVAKRSLGTHDCLFANAQERVRLRRQVGDVLLAGHDRSCFQEIHAKQQWSSDAIATCLSAPDMLTTTDLHSCCEPFVIVSWASPCCLTCNCTKRPVLCRPCGEWFCHAISGRMQTHASANDGLLVLDLLTSFFSCIHM